MKKLRREETARNSCSDDVRYEQLFKFLFNSESKQRELSFQKSIFLVKRVELIGKILPLVRIQESITIHF